MKLTLEHLAPYLAYGVKFTSVLDDPNEIRNEKTAWTADGITNLFGDYCISTKENNDAYPIQTVSLLLRPLSEVSEVTPAIADYLRDKCDGYPNRLPWIEFRELLENHFDVFGLIDPNLAISKNTM